MRFNTFLIDELQNMMLFADASAVEEVSQET
jgi:hypothetical protein